MRPRSGTEPPARGRPLGRRFYARPAEVVARALLGRLIVRDTAGGPLVGRIVEAEAYGGRDDPASHAFRGETPRNRAMFGPPGHAYVYLAYGVHHCLNVVTGRAGRASAVLIRALEPVAGVERMARRRRTRDRDRLARGPGCVARALGLSLADDGADLTRGSLWLSGLRPRRGRWPIRRSARIGIARATGRPWRYFLEGHPCVSGGPMRRSGPRSGRRRR